MNVFEELGSLALATRLKLLGENLAKDVANVYRQLDISFEPRWFTLFWTLKHRQTLTITELAKELRQTHAAVVQVANQLEKKGLLTSSKDKNDERRRQISLSPKGLKLFEEVEPVLNAIHQANQDLIQLTAPDFLQNLNDMEQALEQKSMHDRILSNLGLINQGIVIKNYTRELQEHFYRLNREWIEEYFGELEENDRQVLLHPEEEIIQKGGMICFALYEKKVVGTAAVQEIHPGIFQLSKFAVSKELRGKGIGKALYGKIKAFAQAKGATDLWLFTSPLLPNTINFYIKLGFFAASMSPEEQQAFKRPTLKMQLPLKPSGRIRTQKQFL